MKKWLMLIIVGVILSTIICFAPLELKEAPIVLYMNISSEFEQVYQIFYSKNGNFTEEKSQKIEYNSPGIAQMLEVELPNDTKSIRIDFGEQEGSHTIFDFVLMYEGKNLVNSTYLKKYIVAENKIASYQWFVKKTVVNTNSSDSYLTLDFSELDFDSTINKMQELRRTQTKQEITVNVKETIWFVVLYVVVCFVILKYYGLVKAYISSMFQNKKMILDFSKNDFKIKYAGSCFGTVWAFVQPIVTIVVYWFVFQVGFRSGNVVEGCPFILWLIAGLVPWFFFVEALSSGTNCLLDYSYLVKKVVFPIHTLPIIRILSTYYIHLFFMVFLFFVFFVYGFFPQVHWLQLIYCEICMLILLIGLVYATSALVIFFKDLSQIIVIIIQIGLWLTPILWDYNSIVNNRILFFILKVNPIFYIIEQYRNALINKKWFFYDFGWTIYFWGVVFVLFGIGLFLFQKLKVHFADVI